MKKLFYLVLAILIVAGFSSWSANDPKAIVEKLALNDKPISGSLTYKIYFFGIIPVGEAVFAPVIEKNYNGRPALVVSANAHTLKPLDGIFKASAAIESVIEKATSNPLVFRQKISMSSKPDIEKDVLYDQAANIITVSGIKRDMLPDTQDPLSAVYNLRRLDFTRVKDFEFNLNSNQKNYMLKGSAELASLKAAKKEYAAAFLKSAISRRDKNPYHKSKVDMVLIVGKGNLPVFIKVFASGALITARLTKIE